MSSSSLKFDPLSLTKKDYRATTEKQKTNFKAFGTVLLDHPKAKEQARKFKSVRRTTRIPNLPDTFDGRNIWKDFLSPVRDQGQCGNCWAVASTAVLSDRFAIQSLNQINVEFSPYAATVCAGVIDSEPEYDPDIISQRNIAAHTEAACNGNTIYNSMTFLYIYGGMEHSCFSKGLFKKKGLKYLDEFQTIEDLPTCQDLAGRDFDTCLGSDIAARYFRSVGSYTIYEDKETKYIDIKEEIYQFGPVVSGFIIYDNFLDDYDGTTIYMGPKPDSQNQGGHAIRIVGWGKEKVNGEDVDYWWIGNSWGKSWGLGGFFKMKMGIERCKLEENVASMIPDIFGLKIIYGFISFDQTPDQVYARKKFYVDRTTGYLFSAIKKIKTGKLRGSLKPLVEPGSLPDFTKTYAGEIDIYPGLYSAGVFSESFREKTEKKGISYKNVFIIWGSIIALFLILYLIKKNKKR